MPTPISVTGTSVRQPDSTDYPATYLPPVKAGEALTGGDPVYLDTATNTYKKVDTSAQVSAKIVGMATHGAGSGQKVTIAVAGEFELGSTAADGVCIAVSATGTLEAIEDLSTGEWIAVLGFSYNGNIRLAPFAVEDQA